MTDETVRYAFEKAKSSWLTTKYVPELNAFGNIEQAVSLLLGEINQREKQSKTFKKIYKLCEDYQTAVKAFLAVCDPATFGGAVAKDNVLELVHAGIGEHQCRVVLDYHRSRRDNLVSLAAEEVLVGFSYFLCS